MRKDFNDGQDHLSISKFSAKLSPFYKDEKPLRIKWKTMFAIIDIRIVTDFFKNPQKLTFYLFPLTRRSILLLFSIYNFFLLYIYR